MRLAAEKTERAIDDEINAPKLDQTVLSRTSANSTSWR